MIWSHHSCCGPTAQVAQRENREAPACCLCVLTNSGDAGPPEVSGDFSCLYKDSDSLELERRFYTDLVGTW